MIDLGALLFDAVAIAVALLWVGFGLGLAFGWLIWRG